jgi:hypothetical protein
MVKPFGVAQMTDPHPAGESKPDASFDEASLVPDAADMTADHAAEAAAETGEAAAAPSREIVLQRLTPHSSWEDVVFSETTEPEPAPQRRVLSTMAIVVLAAAVGAAGGALATVGVSHALKNDRAVVAVAEQGRSVDSAIAKINAEIAALKSASAAQSAKLGERIDRVEKAQAEPAAKLAKLSEAVEKLRAAETTGTVTKPTATPAPAPAASVPNRLPLVEGWVLREVADGIATVQGRPGIFDVIPGDPLPGVGRVDAIRRQDGRWVVVTSRGLIVAR